MISIESQFLIWQLVDSAFPSGGFAHSNGLEAAWQAGEVTDRQTLIDFVQSSSQQAARSTLIYARESYRHPEEFYELDTALNAFLTNHVANRASRSQGVAFLATMERIFASKNLQALKADVKSRGLRCHFATAFGRTTRLIGLTEATASSLFMFLALRGLISSAVRLGIVGPHEGQAIQLELSPVAHALTQTSSDYDTTEAVQTAPFAELLLANHDRLYSRLFQS